jgi:hypothetical protein
MRYRVELSAEAESSCGVSREMCEIVSNARLMKWQNTTMPSGGE